MKILMTGATGLIGRQLGIELVRLGHEITALTRRGNAADLCFPARCLAWDHLNPLPKSVICPADEKFDVVIHLAGEPVSQRWTGSARQRIYDSRVKSTRALIESFSKIGKFPAVWLNASAIGIYPESNSQSFDEKSNPGQEFLATTCKDWEAPLQEIPSSSRTVALRFGVVLSDEGGALPKMLTPFIYGVGGPIGNGQQYMSWIHIEDAVKAIIHCITTDTVRGAANIVAPNASTNNELTKELAKATKMPAYFPVPVFILRLLFGKMSSIITGSCRVSPKVLSETGFQFKYPSLAGAIGNLLSYCSPRGTRIFVARQWIKGSPESNFPFFSAAENLETITPPWLNFKIVRKSAPEIKEGILIDYKLRIKGLPVRWRTRIENWNPPHQFVDTQLRGPYRTWHHTHTFEKLGAGTLMTDRVLYRMYFWPFGDVGLPMVTNDVNMIFTYRKKIIEKALTGK